MLGHLEAMGLAVGEFGAKGLVDGVRFNNGRRRRQFLGAVGGGPGRRRVFFGVLRTGAIVTGLARLTPPRAHDEEYRCQEEACA